MKTKIKQKIPSNPVCKECGFPIVKHQKYWVHGDGTVLCAECFKKFKPEAK